MTHAHRTASSNPSPATYPPGFMVLHGNRLEDLRGLLTHLLKSQPLPVLQPEVILVQSNGMKHWLEMALADDAALGICAATRMELPASYLWQVYRSVLGRDAVPQQLVFDKGNLLWRLMRLLPALVNGDSVYAPLQRYLQGDADGRRLYQLAQQIADVFDGYQSYRADWLADWAAGQDVLRNPLGGASALPDEHRWQAFLWRAIRADVGEALADASRASVHARCMQRLQAQLAAGEQPPGLPPRIVVFGISSLSLQTVEALALLGQFSQVLLLVQNPCQYFWGDIVEGHALLRQQLRRRQQAKPGAMPTGGPQRGLFDAPGAHDAHTASHPLLASWGKQGRDYLHLLDGFDRVEEYRGRVVRVDAFIDPATLTDQPNQLAQLQSAILNLEPTPAVPRPLDADDDSITLVSTHAAQREVEVLHDRLLSWFEADPALQPRDVMVMVPDMESFAPHIHAVFGRFARGTPRHIPYAVADNTARQSPLVQALEQLLQLPDARLSLLDWLSLFEVAPVRTRFGLSPADVTQLQGWLSAAGVRWGLDAAHRQRWGFPEAVQGRDQNTWAFGLRRLLLGYAVGPGSTWAGTLPQAAIKSLDASLVSHLLDWLDAVDQSLAALGNAQTPQQWGATLSALVERFFLASDDTEGRLLQRLQEPLETWQQACADAALESPMPLDVVRDHWLAQLDEGGLQQRFFGGGVQFGTLMPMRSIPFKVICLLCMNDGDYPRQTAPRDFDLMASSWRAGDRSRREDDRYLFLEALLSARERLYISWQGHRATDNTAQPPSVLVAQLMDYLGAGWAPPREAQQQPLQPYSEAYFLQDSPFQTFDAEWARMHPAAEPAGAHASMPGDLAGAVLTAAQTASAGAGAGAGAGAVADTASEGGAMPSAPPTALTLDDLRQLLRHPAEVFFRARLRIRFAALEEAQQEQEPFAPDGLEKYDLGQHLLQAADPALALADLQRSGRLPLAGFGEMLAESLEREATVVRERRQPWLERFPHACPSLSVALQIDGCTVAGTLSGLASAEPVTDATPARSVATPCLQLSARLGAVLEGKAGEEVARGHIVCGLWINHLAACASGMALTSVQLGLVGEVVFAPLAQAQAHSILQALVHTYHAAWQRPLPAACKTGWAWLQAAAKAAQQAAAQPDMPDKIKDPHEVAQAVFEGSYQLRGEWADSPYLARAFDSYQDIEDALPQWAHALYAEMAAHAHVPTLGEAGE